MGYTAPVFISDYVTPYLQIKCRCGRKSLVSKDRAIHHLKTMARTERGGPYAVPRIQHLYRHLVCKGCGQLGQIDIEPVPQPAGTIQWVYELDEWSRLEVSCRCGHTHSFLVKDLLYQMKLKSMTMHWDKLPGRFRCRQCRRKGHVTLRRQDRERR